MHVSSHQQPQVLVSSKVTNVCIFHQTIYVYLPWREGHNKYATCRNSNIHKDIVKLSSLSSSLVCLLRSLFPFIYLFLKPFRYTQQEILSWIPSGNSIPTKRLPTQLPKGHHGPLLYLQVCVCVCVCFPVSQLRNSSVKESARSQGGTRPYSYADVHLNTEQLVPQMTITQNTK